MKFPLHNRTPRICVAALAAITLVSIASAYVLEGPKWTASNVTFQFRLGNAGHSLTDGNVSWDVAALPAIDAWNSHVGNVHINGVINPSAPLNSGDGVNSIGFSGNASGQSFGSSTLAITLYYYSGNRMSEADIFVNNHQTWDSYRGGLRFGGNGYAIADVRRVLTHELGHAIGLNHPPNGVDAIMHASISNRDSLSSDDIRGGQALYGAPAAGPTPTPAPSATPLPGAPSTNVTVAPGRARKGAPAFFTIALSSPQSSPTTVNFAITGGQNSLYRLNPASHFVTIPAGQSTATVALSVKKRPKHSRAVSITLTPDQNYGVTTPGRATVTITR